MISLPIKLCKLISRFSPDLVHSHTDIPDFVVSAARRLIAFRIVRTIHNTSLWATHPWSGFVAEQGFSNDLVIGVSHDALDAYKKLRQRYGLSPSIHQRVIVNGIRIRPSSVLENVKRHHCRRNPLRVAYFGRSDPTKGLDLLIKAILTHGGQNLPMELFIFSDVALDHSFKNQVASFPCPLHLSLPVPNAWELMAKFDLLVMPSRVEGLGLVALEALAAQTPVIATRIPGLREALPPDWPLLVPPDDPEALMCMLRAVMQGQFDLVELGIRGYDYVKTNSIEFSSCEYRKAYFEYTHSSCKSEKVVHPV